MNKNAEEPWSTGLIRSYSEHAAVLLEHFQKQNHYPTSFKYPHSTSVLYNEDQTSMYSKPDNEDERSNSAYQSWQSSTTLLEDEKQMSNQCHKITEIGCGDSSALSTKFSELSLIEQHRLDDTNCYQGITECESISLPSINQNKRSSVEAVLSNDDDTCNGSNEYQLSVETKSDQEDYSNSAMIQTCDSSISLNTTSRRQSVNSTRIPKNISYENWAQEKQRKIQQRRNEARRAEIKRSEAEECKRREKEAKQLQEYECFLEWTKRKKREKMLKKKLVAKELEFEKQLYDFEKKTQLIKSIGLLQWHKEKEKQQKASEKKMLKKQKKSEEEKEKRLQESVKAYEEWREKAKNTPRPATQGLLPHQKAKPGFTNPTPWKSILDSVSDDSDITTQSSALTKTVKNQRSKRTNIKR